MTAPFLPCTPAEAEAADRVMDPYAWEVIDWIMQTSSAQIRAREESRKMDHITAMQRAVDVVLKGRAAG